jgi:hypothetical protein
MVWGRGAKAPPAPHFSAPVCVCMYVCPSHFNCCVGDVGLRFAYACRYDNLQVSANSHDGGGYPLPTQRNYANQLESPVFDL